MRIDALRKKTYRITMPKIIVMVILVLLSINPGYTQGKNNLNLLLCGAMCLSPLVLLMKRARVFIPQVDIPLLAVCFFIMVWPAIFNPSTIRPITMLFTCAYCITVMMLARMVRIAEFTETNLCQLIKWIIIAFAIVLLIQQFCVLTGLPVIFESMLYPNPWKLNSLTAEPSHTSVTLAALMFFYSQAWVEKNGNCGLTRMLVQEYPVWLCWAWVIFSTHNSSAFLLAPLPFMPFITKKNLLVLTGIIFAAVMLLIFTPVGNTGQIIRLRNTLKGVVTLDDEKIKEADLSASARILPTLHGAKAISEIDTKLLTGHGVDADKKDLPNRYYRDDENGFAGHFSMLYNYGLPAALAFITAIMILTLIPMQWTTWLTMLYAIWMSADYNMQLCWVIMCFGMAVKVIVFKKTTLLETCANLKNKIKRDRSLS